MPPRKGGLEEHDAEDRPGGAMAAFTCIKAIVVPALAARAMAVFLPAGGEATARFVFRRGRARAFSRAILHRVSADGTAQFNVPLSVLMHFGFAVLA